MQAAPQAVKILDGLSVKPQLIKPQYENHFQDCKVEHLI